MGDRRTLRGGGKFRSLKRTLRGGLPLVRAGRERDSFHVMDGEVVEVGGDGVGVVAAALPVGRVAIVGDGAGE